MPHQIYLVQILVSQSQFCCTVLSASYMKIIINNCRFKAKLFRNARELQSQVFWNLRLSKDDWSWHFKEHSSSLDYLILKDDSGIHTCGTLETMHPKHHHIPEDLNPQHCCKNLKTDIRRLLNKTLSQIKSHVTKSGENISYRSYVAQRTTG